MKREKIRDGEDMTQPLISKENLIRQHVENGVLSGTKKQDLLQDVNTKMADTVLLIPIMSREQLQAMRPIHGVLLFNQKVCCFCHKTSKPI